MEMMLTCYELIRKPRPRQTTLLHATFRPIAHAGWKNRLNQDFFFLFN